MKCYYHSLEDAVGQCCMCKRFLCKTCFDSLKDGLCSICLRKEETAEIEYIRACKERSIRENQQEYRRYIRNLVIASIVGIVLSCIIIAISLPGRVNVVYTEILIVAIITCYSTISVYSGYEILKGILPDLIEVEGILDLKLFVNYLYNIFKLPIALIVGLIGAIPLFIKKRNIYKKASL